MRTEVLMLKANAYDLILQIETIQQESNQRVNESNQRINQLQQQLALTQQRLQIAMQKIEEEPLVEVMDNGLIEAENK